MKAQDYNNYKLGALKRKFKTGRADVAPGTFINLAKAQKETESQEDIPSKEKVSIMGLV